MKNSNNDFIDSYNDIKRYLIKNSGLSKDTHFDDLLDKVARKNKIIDNNKDLLKKFHKLRNIISHETSTGIYIEIAKVTDKGAEKISKIAQILHQPPKVIPFFEKNVCFLKNENSISEAVKIMHDKNYSQIPLYDKEEKFKGLLTTNTIVRWLGSCVSEELCDLKETSIDYVFNNFTECKENCDFISRDKTLFDIVDIFFKFEAKGKRLEAILITENGNKEEKPLGIITVWDLVEINKKLEI